jgi:hypothetical protein
VNDPRGWALLVDAGVTGIITDRPHTLKAWLAERRKASAEGEAKGTEQGGK